MSVAGGIIGVVSSLVGIGGGTLSVPFLLWNNLDMRKAIGTSAAIGFPIALAGCFGYIVNGWNAANLPPYSFGYIYRLPSLFGIVVVSMFTAPLGARLAQTLPVPKLKKCFALLLIVIGIRDAAQGAVNKRHQKAGSNPAFFMGNTLFRPPQTPGVRGQRMNTATVQKAWERMQGTRLPVFQ